MKKNCKKIRNFISIKITVTDTIALKNPRLFLLQKRAQLTVMSLEIRFFGFRLCICLMAFVCVKCGLFVFACFFWVRMFQKVPHLSFSNYLRNFCFCLPKKYGIFLVQ